MAASEEMQETENAEVLRNWTGVMGHLVKERGLAGSIDG
jgi:hypothetical protein